MDRTTLGRTLNLCLVNLQEHLESDNSLASKVETVVSSSDALKVSVRIHLFTLLCEEMKIACARQLEGKGIVPKLLRLLNDGQLVLATRSNMSESDGKLADSTATPKWMAPLLLLLDLYEKMSLGVRRRAAMEKVTSQLWTWFDVASGKWGPYTPANNKIIDDAFWSGQNSVRVSASRRRYLVQFTSMIQVNEETGNRRPIMLLLKGNENTEQDVSAAAESLENLADNEAVVSDGDNPLEDIMDQHSQVF